MIQVERNIHLFLTIHALPWDFSFITNFTLYIFHVAKIHSYIDHKTHKYKILDQPAPIICVPSSLSVSSPSVDNPRKSALSFAPHIHIVTVPNRTTTWTLLKSYRAVCSMPCHHTARANRTVDSNSTQLSSIGATHQLPPTDRPTNPSGDGKVWGREP